MTTAEAVAVGLFALSCGWAFVNIWYLGRLRADIPHWLRWVVLQK